MMSLNRQLRLGADDALRWGIATGRSKSGERRQCH